MKQPHSLCLLLFLLLSAAASAQTEPCGRVTIGNPDTIRVCPGEVIQLTQTNTLNDENLQWSPAEGFLDPTTDPNPRVAPVFSRYYRVVVGTAGTCQVADSVFVDVARFVVPDLIADRTVCQGDEFQLVNAPVDDPGTTTYTFSPGLGFLKDSTDVNAVLSAQRDTVFTLISTARDGICADTQSVRITVTPSVLDINRDTAFVCLGGGDEVLTVSVAPGRVDGAITWSPTRFNLSPPTGATYRVRPTADITYYAEATVNGCPQIDSIAVRLDSLPTDLSMMLDPEKDPYCQGDTFFVRSPIYDAGDFPLITHDWTVAPGIQSPLDLYNGVFIAQDTATLRRITTNGSCSDTTEILVNVVEPPTIVFDPPNPIVCPGEPLQIMATFESGSGSLNWMDPGGTLSCTDCLDPIATVNAPTEYMIEAMVEGTQCTAPLTYSIDVQPDIEPDLIATTTVCPGDPVRLIIGNIVSGYTYRITGGGEDISDPTLPVIPTETTTYTVETTGRCGTTTQTVTINVAAAADYRVIAQGPETVGENERLTLSATSDPPNITGTYTWILPSGIGLTGQEITVDNPVTGVYEVRLTDAGGCAFAVDTITVTVVGGLAIPEVITPNGDGTNDEFRLFFGGTISDYTIIVFNRWGQKVWTSTDPAEGWDGTKDGTPQNQDTYLFLVKFRQDGAEMEREGQFTLVR